MKNQITRQLLGLMALLFSSVGMAATVTVVPSTATPNAGDTFTLTITADVGNTLAATMQVAFDATKVTWLTGGTMPDNGPFSAANGGSFTKNTAYDSGSVFDISTNTATSASPGTYDAVTLTFQAIASGAANIVINDDGGGCCLWADATTAEYIPVDYVQASVTVQAVPQPDITVTESSGVANDNAVDFGSVVVATTSPIVTVTVTNNGDLPLTVSAINGVAAPYAVDAENCTVGPLAALASCTIDLTFTPSVLGAAPGSMDIVSDDPQTPTVTVTLAGTGIPTPAPEIDVSTSSIDFGTIVENTTSAPEQVTVTNSGNLDLNITQIGATLAAPYSLLNDTCSNTTVAASGGTCTFDVQFAPTSVGGPFLATVDIPSDDADENPFNIDLTGSAAAAVPDITVSSLAVDFGTVFVGVTGNATVTVTNDGNADLTISSVDPTLLVPQFSIVTEDCTVAPLAPTQSCTIDLAFDPDAAQPYSGSFAILSDDPDAESTVTVDVDGAGAVPVPEITVSGPVDFGNVNVGSTGSQTITVTNDGNGNLVIGTVDDSLLDSTFSIATDNCTGATLAPDDTCTIDLEFAPDAITSYDGSIDIPSNDADEAIVTVDVTGNGVAASSGSGFRENGGGSALDAVSLLALGLFGIGLKRRRR